MKGLECSEIMLSELVIDNLFMRLDAEFFNKKMLYFDKFIKQKPHYFFSKDNIVSGPFGSSLKSSSYLDNGAVPFVRAENIKNNFFISLDNLVYISEFDNNRIINSELRNGDLILSKVGNIGSFATLPNTMLRCNISENNIGIKLNNHSDEVKTFLLVYLNCKYGNSLVVRRKSGNVQPKLNVSDLTFIPLPIFTEKFYSFISRKIHIAESKLQQSQSVYHSAEQLLLKSLGLENWQPKNEVSTIKKYSDYEKSGRLDAEYYQPKYEEIEKKIKQKGFVLAKDVCSLINYGTVPTSPYTSDDSGTPYIKGMNLKNTAIDDNLDKIVNTDSLDEKFFTKKGDIIISQMGTVADVGVVNEKQENYLFASFTIRMRLKSNVEFNPVFVGMYIQNVAKEYYFYRYIAQASVRQNTDLPTVKNLYIPKIDKSIQKDIAEKVQESFRLRQESKELLERAKRAVEMAIEEGEEKAIYWLEHNKNLEYSEKETELKMVAERKE